MRTVAEHLAAALALAAPLPATAVPLDRADGQVLAADVRTSEPLPRWDNSAMDGYAVRHADLASASPEHPVTLTVAADLAAGSAARPTVVAGTAARIMTGAPLPPGADAVVPVEHTDGGTVTVRVDRAPAPGAHIRRAGEDAVPGDLVLAAGTLLGATQVAAAASVGAAELVVHRRPRVAVVSTGSELVAPGTPLDHGLIPDSNSYLLQAAARSAGAVVERVGAVRDDARELHALLDRLGGTVDLVVTSGGVSMGAYDVVKEALTGQAGMEFVQVAMQPGKPQGLGRLPTGTPVLALPGNPVSAYVSFEVFVHPVLRRMRGLDPALPTTWAVAAVGWRTPPGRQQYMPVVWQPGVADDGHAPGREPAVRPAVGGGSGSHLVAGLGRAEAFAVVPPEVEEVHPGDRVRVMGLRR